MEVPGWLSPLRRQLRLARIGSGFPVPFPGFCLAKKELLMRPSPTETTAGDRDRPAALITIGVIGKRIVVTLHWCGAVRISHSRLLRPANRL